MDKYELPDDQNIIIPQSGILRCPKCKGRLDKNLECEDCGYSEPDYHNAFDIE